MIGTRWWTTKVWQKCGFFKHGLLVLDLKASTHVGSKYAGNIFSTLCEITLVAT